MLTLFQWTPQSVPPVALYMYRGTASPRIVHGAHLAYLDVHSMSKLITYTAHIEQPHPRRCQPLWRPAGVGAKPQLMWCRTEHVHQITSFELAGGQRSERATAMISSEDAVSAAVRQDPKGGPDNILSAAYQWT